MKEEKYLYIERGDSDIAKSLFLSIYYLDYAFVYQVSVELNSMKRLKCDFS
jgi:hypothetical protein